MRKKGRISGDTRVRVQFLRDHARKKRDVCERPQMLTQAEDTDVCGGVLFLRAAPLDFSPPLGYNNR